MIQCIINACGEICQPALEKTNKDGKKFLSFTVKIPISGRSGSISDLFLSVSVDGDYSQIGKYTLGRKVSFKGKMIPRKYKGLIYYNVHSEGDILTADPECSPFITGTMDFKGKIGKKVQDLTDKKGRSFQSFSAFSSNKTGQETEYIWIHFMNFHLKENNKVSPEQSVAISGDFHFNVYKDVINLECIIQDISQWEWTREDSITDK
jgi:hypothetical protein